MHEAEIEHGFGPQREPAEGLEIGRVVAPAGHRQMDPVDAPGRAGGDAVGEGDRRRRALRLDDVLVSGVAVTEMEAELDRLGHVTGKPHEPRD